MTELRTNTLKEDVRKVFEPFLEELLTAVNERFSAIYATGSALTDDYLPQVSDINSLIP